MTTLPDLLVDLDDEYGDLRAVVAGLDDSAPEWDLPTPAEGWAVRDQISHLAFFDDAGRMAMVEPAAFAAMVDRFMAGTGDPMEVHLTKGRSMGGDELLDWWGDRSPGDGRGIRHGGSIGPGALVRTADGGAVVHLGAADGDLGPRSGRVRRVRGRPAPDRPTAPHRPSGSARPAVLVRRPWQRRSRGSDRRGGHRTGRGRVAVGDRERKAGNGAGDGVGASDKGEASHGADDVATVRGSALDFCLAVTQRRNVADTDLVVTGPLAVEWMSIAQAFAGPPGPGRPAVSN